MNRRLGAAFERDKTSDSNKLNLQAWPGSDFSLRHSFGGIMHGDRRQIGHHVI
jgi:hypothetical protein